jgi:Tannase and feruloyl esterase
MRRCKMRSHPKVIVVYLIVVVLLLVPRSGFSALCTDMKNSSFGLDVTVTSATVVAATATEPEHCDVRGNVLPEIGFAVKLPTQWNGRFYMAGNHGKAGEVDHEAIKRGLRRGYATAGTETGHDIKKEPGSTFAYHNRQKEIDFGYRSVHETAVAAKEIIRAYYGRLPAFSYFVGSSTGGRQALMEAQRYPMDFNGILSGNPFPDYLELIRK